MKRGSTYIRIYIGLDFRAHTVSDLSQLPANFCGWQHVHLINVLLSEEQLGK